MVLPNNALSISRYIAAPPERVWQVMTERQGEWWCPRPWRAEFELQEWRAGGRTVSVMYGPDGEQHHNEGVFLEVTPGVRFVSTDAFTRDEQGNWQTAGPFMAGNWEIAPEGDGTRYTATALHWTETAGKEHDEMGFTDGWGACADQLAALCEKGEL